MTRPLGLGSTACPSGTRACEDAPFRAEFFKQDEGDMLVRVDGLAKASLPIKRVQSWVPEPSWDRLASVDPI